MSIERESDVLRAEERKALTSVGGIDSRHEPTPPTAIHLDEKSPVTQAGSEVRSGETHRTESHPSTFWLWFMVQLIVLMVAWILVWMKSELKSVWRS